MKCEQANELLSAYIDEMIGEKEAKALEAHLAQCANCRKELDASRFLRGVMREMETPLPPDKFSSVVQRRLQENKNKIFSATTIEQPKKGGWAVAVLAGLALALGIYASSYLSVGEFFVGWQDKKEERKPRIAIEDILERFQQWKQEGDETSKEITEPAAKIDANPRVKAGMKGEKESAQEAEPESSADNDNDYSAQIIVRELPVALAQVMELADKREIKYSVLSGSYDSNEARRVIMEVEPQDIPQLMDELRVIMGEPDMAEFTADNGQDKNFQVGLEEEPPLLKKKEINPGVGNQPGIKKAGNAETEETQVSDEDRENAEDSSVNEEADSPDYAKMQAELQEEEDRDEIAAVENEEKAEGTKINFNILIIQEKSP